MFNVQAKERRMRSYWMWQMVAPAVFDLLIGHYIDRTLVLLKWERSAHAQEVNNISKQHFLFLR
jgi:hypothetical protein